MVGAGEVAALVQIREGSLKKIYVGKRRAHKFMHLKVIMCKGYNFGIVQRKCYW